MDYMPGTASLIEEIDKKQLVMLRDGRIYIGYLRSVDQFANLVLQQAIERIHVNKMYGDIHRGIIVIRGENVVLLGEIDIEAQDHKDLQKVSGETILAAQNTMREEKIEKESSKIKAMKERGLIPTMDHTEDMY